MTGTRQVGGRRIFEALPSETGDFVTRRTDPYGAREWSSAVACGQIWGAAPGRYGDQSVAIDQRAQLPRFGR